MNFYSRLCMLQTVRAVRLSSSKSDGTGGSKKLSKSLNFKKSGKSKTSESVNPTGSGKCACIATRDEYESSLSSSPKPASKEAYFISNGLLKSIESNVLANESPNLYGHDNKSPKQSGLRDDSGIECLKAYFDGQINFYKMQMKLNKTAMKRIRRLRRLCDKNVGPLK